MDLKQEWLNLISKYDSDESTNHDVIYKTDELINKLESNVRKNLEKELNLIML